ncbi:DUF3592 domain-containing protein [Halomicronema sp. CCY15110]|uniref:DUF3592 domain-containing protein n=1 Tax=Halomicronema sp. CCY15110 TaxID=2767773 RepID=UPI00195051BD|nr:DUF3592 domain-containing protein [Halomicronema sp. CCY15110]
MTTPTPITPAQYRIIAGFGGFLILIGAALSIFGVIFLKSALASYTWPSTPGLVQAVTSNLYYSESNGSIKTYSYTVAYQYEVAEISYTGDRYSLGAGPTASQQQYDSHAEAQRAGKAAYPPGSEVTVYYDPKTPTAAVLQPGANWGTYVPLMLGAVFLPSGVLFFKVLARAQQAAG